jgi:hypothetical protein
LPRIHLVLQESAGTLVGELAILRIGVQRLASPGVELKLGVAAHGADAVRLAADLGLALVVEAPKLWHTLATIGQEGKKRALFAHFTLK